MPRKRRGRRDFGSIASHGTPTNPLFSAVWFEGGRKRRRRGFTTRGEAEAFLARVRVELESGERQIGDPVIAEGLTVGQAIEAYAKHLTDKGLKPRPIEDRAYRLGVFFPDRTLLLADLTRAKCAALYEVICRAHSPRTGRPYSVDTHRSMLLEARMLAKFAVGRHWLKANPLDGIEGRGKRRHGKAQLRIDEARRWMGKAAELADQGDAGAVAAMMALLLGMRASEITTRVVRDLDDDGRLLWIPQAKTEAGKRTLHIPDMLRQHLQALTAGKRPEGRLFGHHWRDWPREQVRRICELAGVPLVTAHGMRGLHSTLAMEAGVTGQVVAASLGHESVSTTVRSYAKAEAVAGAQQRRALTVLAGGLASAKEPDRNQETTVGPPEAAAAEG